MPENNQLLSVESQLVGLPLAGPESFSQAQLDYMKRALGVDETVLWEGTYSGSVNDSNFITLSEDPRNFDTIEISNGGNYKSKFRFGGASDSWSFMQTYAAVNGTTVYCNRYSIDAGNKKVTCKACNTFVINSNNSITNWQTASMGVGEVQLSKIVGIHRIAGGN